MENKITVSFCKENKDVEIDMNQPNLSELVQEIIQHNLLVENSNVLIKSTDEEFDSELFKGIILEAYEEFKEEVDLFYKNIKKDIQTYYDDEELGVYIIEEIKKTVAD